MGYLPGVSLVWHVSVVDSGGPREENDAPVAEDPVKEHLARVIVALHLDRFKLSDFCEPGSIQVTYW